MTETAGFDMLTELEAFTEWIAARRPFPTPLDQILHGAAVVAALAVREQPVTVG